MEEEGVKLHLTLTKKVSLSVLFLNLESVTIIASNMTEEFTYSDTSAALCITLYWQKFTCGKIMVMELVLGSVGLIPRHVL
jgi:hypothetical protein